jgi:hypothetical protein
MPTNESRVAVAELRRITGKRYPKLEGAIEHLDAEAARELLQLTRDLDGAIHQAERRAATQPWRYGR